MKTSFATPATGRLLIDWEHGNVLRADDLVVITARHADVHPFIERDHGELVVGKGPSQQRYAILRESDSFLELQRKEDVV